jgi:hypothetical protein
MRLLEQLKDIDTFVVLEVAEALRTSKPAVKLFGDLNGLVREQDELLSQMARMRTSFGELKDLHLRKV